MMSLRSRGIEDHMRVAQLLLVILEAAHFDRAVRQEAMSQGRIAAFHAGEFERHHFAVEGATMPCSGRTQRVVPAVQRMDFGQGSLAIASGTISASTSAVARPARDHGDVEFALGVGLFAAHWSSVTPAERRNPSSAFSGAPTRGPLRSSRVSGCLAGRPAIASVSRRGPEKARAFEHQPRSDSAPTTRRSRSFAAAPACARDFLGEKFKQKIGHLSPIGRCASHTSACRRPCGLASQASQQALASVRTRRYRPRAPSR
jgi:hypothetical protein